MKFKILKGTESFDKFMALQDLISGCHKAAAAVAKKVGVKEWHPAWWAMSGGISAFVFDKKPAGWANAFIPHEDKAYMPKKNLVSNKELLAEIRELPVVQADALNKIVKYDPGKCRSGRQIMRHPGFLIKKDYVLLTFSDYVVKYKGTKDMIEITHTEFEKLSKAK